MFTHVYLALNKETNINVSYLIDDMSIFKNSRMGCHNEIGSVITVIETICKYGVNIKLFGATYWGRKCYAVSYQSIQSVVL